MYAPQGRLLAVLAGTVLATTTGAHAVNQLTNASFEVVGPNGGFTEFTGYGGGGNAAAEHWGVFNNTEGTTRTQLVTSTLGGGGNRMLYVWTDGGANGVGQVFGAYDTGPACVESGVWVYVVSGRVYIGAGNGGNTGPNVYSTTVGAWEHIQGDNLVCPANNYIIYADYGFEQVEFYVDLASVEPFSCQGPTGGINQDGTVGFEDLIILLTEWGPCDGACTADLDGNGVVNFTDLVLMLHTWGECGGV